VVHQNREEEKNALAFFDSALRRGVIAKIAQEKNGLTQFLL